MFTYSENFFLVNIVSTHRTDQCGQVSEGKRKKLQCMVKYLREIRLAAIGNERCECLVSM